jgi:hypothetical protein
MGFVPPALVLLRATGYRPANRQPLRHRPGRIVSLAKAQRSPNYKVSILRVSSILSPCVLLAAWRETILAAACGRPPFIGASVPTPQRFAAWGQKHGKTSPPIRVSRNPVGWVSAHADFADDPHTVPSDTSILQWSRATASRGPRAFRRRRFPPEFCRPSSCSGRPTA